MSESAYMIYILYNLYLFYNKKKIFFPFKLIYITGFCREFCREYSKRSRLQCRFKTALDNKETLLRHLSAKLNSNREQPLAGCCEPKHNWLNKRISPRLNLYSRTRFAFTRFARRACLARGGIGNFGICSARPVYTRCPVHSRINLMLISF